MITLTRSEHNPIFAPDPGFLWEAQGTFNPGVVYAHGEAIMLYRAVGELEAYISRFGLARSTDGVHFTRASDTPVFSPGSEYDKWGAEDPRITQIEDDFYITYVGVPERIMLNGSSFPRTTPLETAGILLHTKDFRTYEHKGIMTPARSDNKDVVLFPRKIQGRYAMLHRPNRWTKSGYRSAQESGIVIDWPVAFDALPEKPSTWIAYSDDLLEWTDHALCMEPSHEDDTKIGPGMPPIETAEGWLYIYHHVEATDRPDGFRYSARAALFALDNPTHCIGKLDYDILAPDMAYEQERNSHIVFPTGGYIRDGILYVYYGASDRTIGLATAPLNDLLLALTQ